jgi:hypothetical protein
MAVCLLEKVNQLRQNEERYGVRKKTVVVEKLPFDHTKKDKKQESLTLNEGVLEAVRKSLIIKSTGNEKEDYMNEAGIDSTDSTDLLTIWLMDAQEVKDIFWGISKRISQELNGDGNLDDAKDILAKIYNKELDEVGKLTDPTLKKAERIIMAQNRSDDEKEEELRDLYRLQAAKDLFLLAHPKDR